MNAGDSLSLLAMLSVGLMGAGHCVGMCGGIVTGLGGAAQRDRTLSLVLGYNLGRITSYALAGALVAVLGRWGANYLALGPVLRILAGVILVLMGLYLADWWKVLVRLEKLGQGIWRHLQPLSRRLLPVTTLPRAMALGAVWGWLPCGLVYTALAYAAASASPGQGALLMAAFGLGTMPAMVAGGYFAGSLRRRLQARPVRIILALGMILFGLWTLVAGVQHLQHRLAEPSRGEHGHQHPSSLMSIKSVG